MTMMPMRRADREISYEEGIKIIDNADYGVLSAIGENNKIISIPLSLVRVGEYLYFHGAKEGEKISSFADGTEVKIVFVGVVNVADIYENSELNAMKSDRDAIKKAVRNVFTTEFESVIIAGTIKELHTNHEKVEVMRAICEKYMSEKMEYFNYAISQSLDITAVYSIHIDDLKAKRKSLKDVKK